MNLQLLILCIFLGLDAYIQGEDSGPVEAAPLPSGTLLVRAPHFAQWQIVYSAKSAAASRFTPNSPFSQGGNASSPSALTQAPLHVITQILVTKTDNTYHRTVRYTDGNDLDEWWVGGTQITQEKGSSGYILSFGEDRFYVDFGASDFPDMMWVNASAYVGIQTLKDVKCLVFKKPIPTTPEDILQSLTPDERPSAMKDTQEATIWVNLKTRLPVQYSTPLENETYSFLLPPDSPLDLPVDGAQILAAWEIKKSQMIHPGPRP